MRTIIVIAVVAALLTTACARATAPQGAAALDQQFIDMMVPHHQSAVAMAKLARERAEHTEIKQLAEAIIRAQDEEIARMKGWRKAWFGSDQTPPMDKMPMLPGMSMPGHNMGGTAGATMDMAADVEKLRTGGGPFDKVFIDAMIAHHQTAIEAARIAQERAERPEIKELARAIIADQQREIDQMKTWRQAWYGSAEPGK